VETRKIDVLFGLVVIAFLAVTLILIKEFNYRRANDFKGYSVTLSNIVKQKNNKIKVLAHRLFEEQKENQGLKNTLMAARNGLDALTKRLAQQASVATPANEPVPVAAPVPVAVAK
jgi:hypothetical protein